MKKYFYIVILLLFTVIVIFFFLRHSSTSSFGKTFNQDSVAVVNGQPIYKDQFDKELAIRTHFFVWAKQDISKETSLHEDVLNSLIDDELVQQFAEKNNITVTEKELNDRYSASYINSSQDQYLQKIKVMYGMTRDDKLEKIRQDIFNEKVQALVKKPLTVWLSDQKEQSVISRKEL